MHSVISHIDFGSDFRADDPLVATFNIDSVQGDSENVVVTIIDDNTLEGNHSFIAEIVDSVHIVAVKGAMISIIDNDGEK